MRNKSKGLNYDAKLLGERIARYRTQAHMTQEQLAERLDMSVPSVSHIENGKAVCDLNVLVGLASVFKIELSKLLYGIALRGVDTENYLLQELDSEIANLSASDKRIIKGVINLLQQEHQRGTSDDDI